ncbi:MAG: hypothetical protein I8H75_02455 [Myxococcaceae bacterium]|nr:hypothetical protein [Myxococcaceae bacterium]MBH2006197.1 hypothetical protein [Myxococcaceae bacterium]
MKRIVAFSWVFGSALVFGATDFPCPRPESRVCLIWDELSPFPEPALPVALTQATKTGSSVSTLLSTVTSVGPSQVAQNARAGLTLSLLSCEDSLPPETGSLGWSESPTQLSLGSGNLQYHLGAVVGNWLLLSGAVGIWSAVAYKLGASRAHFPGSLVLPVLFLISPTTSSSFALIRQGNILQGCVGSGSLILSFMGTSVAGVALHPRFFKARWDAHEKEWVDMPPSSAWLAKYGELFETYGKDREWYILIELMTSMAVGALQSYQALQADCGNLLWAGMAVYDAYALSQFALWPNQNQHAQRFYAAVAALQAIALSTQAIASATASEETQQKIKSVTQTIVVVTEYAMMLKTLFDIGLRFKSWYEHFRPSKKLNALAKSSSSSEAAGILLTEMAGPLQGSLPALEADWAPSTRAQTPIDLNFEDLDFIPEATELTTAEELFESNPTLQSFGEVLKDAQMAYEESKNPSTVL